MHRSAPPNWRVWTTSDGEREPARRGAEDIRTVLVPHCYGYVCLLDAATGTAYVSLEFDALTRASSLCRAIEEYQRQPQQPRLQLVPPAVDDERVVPLAASS